MTFVMSNFVVWMQFMVAYLFTFLLFPYLLMRPLLVGRDMRYKIVFVQTVANVYMIYWGFLLVFMHQFTAGRLFFIIFVLPLAIRLLISRNSIRQGLVKARQLILDYKDGLYGTKLIRRNIGKGIKFAVKRLYETFFKGNILQIVAWCGFISFIVFYYGYYKLHHYGYAYTDEETHLYWIQSLIHDNPFPTGMYPHGAHFLVSTITMLFGIPVVSSWHMFSLFTAVMIFWTLYLMLRTVFDSKGACVFGLGVVLMSDIFEVTSYFRYQFSVPMEFSFISLFAFIIALIYFAKDKDRMSIFFFIVTLVWTFHTHFYMTIAAALFCIVFGIIYLIPMLRNKTLVKIIAAGIASIIIMLAPFIAGFALGYTFERSIAWGIEILQGGSGNASLEGASTDEKHKIVYREDLSPEKLADVEYWEKVMESNPLFLSEGEVDGLKTALGDYDVDDVSGREYVISLATTPEQKFYMITKFLIKYVFRHPMTAAIFIGIAALELVFSFLMTIICVLRKKPAEKYLAYMFMVAIWITMLVVHIFPNLDLPAFLEIKRSASVLVALTSALIALPLDVAYSVLMKIPGVRKVAGVLFLVASIGFLGFGYETGYSRPLHRLYYNIAIQDIDLKLCNDLLTNKEDYTWTVISPTNDLSVVRYQGFHYEIVDLMDELRYKDEIYIPTEYIYVIVEHDTINFGTNHAERRNIDGSDYLTYSKPIDSQYVTMSFEEIGSDKWSSRDRAYYESRVQIMSKLYYWMEKMKDVYPSEITVYDEDEYCTVYQIKQDPYFLLNLAVDYQAPFRTGEPDEDSIEENIEE